METSAQTQTIKEMEGRPSRKRKAEATNGGSRQESQMDSRQESQMDQGPDPNPPGTAHRDLHQMGLECRECRNTAIKLWTTFFTSTEGRECK